MKLRVRSCRHPDAAAPDSVASAVGRSAVHRRFEERPGIAITNYMEPRL